MTVSNDLGGMEEGGFDLDTATAEAGRCLLCEDPPCSKGCPAKTDPGAFIRKLRFRNITGAIRTVKENNILGGACGVLCPTARLCEKDCNAKWVDRPIRIGKVQRFLMEHAWATGFKVFGGKVFEKPARRPGKVAVVGAGPAGLSCAAELAKHGHRVTVFEARPEPGGVLRYGVPAFRFETAFLKKELEDLKDLGVELKCSSPVAEKGAAERLLADGYDAVFLATGLWNPERLPGTRKEPGGLFTSMDFLAALRQGRRKELAKSFKGKACAVLGGGSVAIDCARVALRLGSRDVYLLYRRSCSQMPAEEDEKNQALREGVHFILLSQPVGYVADARGRLAGVRLVRTRLGAEDSSGRRKPVELKGSEWTLEVSAAVEAIGYKPVDGSQDWYPSVAVRQGGLIRADEDDCRTSAKGIFAGGDIIRGPDLVVRAVQDGKTAAGSILQYLGEKATTRPGERCLARKP
ncbi:MAG: NAD(P)-dependent oxidoreductase [Elusimicrobia bacterium]|nr:NAD(P)-dependent oxidoreductase [Elusimicrobiota bacterium]